MIQIKPINMTLLKYLPYIVIVCVILASIIAFELGGNLVCLNSGGNILISQKCTKIIVNEYTICPGTLNTAGFPIDYKVLNASNYTKDVN